MPNLKTGMRFQWYGEAFKEKIARHVSASLMVWGLTCEGVIKRHISGPYVFAGTYPSVQTGRLRQSISTEQERLSRSYIRQKVGSSIAPRSDQAHSYPWYLELGTSQHKARPYLRISYDETIAVLITGLRGGAL